MPTDASAAIRTQLLAALQQRAASLDGAARQAIQTRVAELAAGDAEAHRDAADAPTDMPPSALRELLDQLTRTDTPGRAAYPEIPALADIRQRWAELRSNRQLQQAVAHAPTDAGPLNSAALASRAIALMHTLSPAYLRTFLAYVDELAWLQQLGQPTAAPAPRKRASRKREG